MGEHSSRIGQIAEDCIAMAAFGLAYRCSLVARCAETPLGEEVEDKIEERIQLGVVRPRGSGAQTVRDSVALASGLTIRTPRESVGPARKSWENLLIELGYSPDPTEFGFAQLVQSCLTLDVGRRASQDGVLVLVDWFGGVSRKELAARLRLSEGCIKTRISRARRRVKDAMKEVRETRARGNRVKALAGERLARYDLPYDCITNAIIVVVGAFVKLGSSPRPSAPIRSIPARIRFLTELVASGSCVRTKGMRLDELQRLLAVLLALVAKAVHNSLSLSYPGSLDDLVGELLGSQRARPRGRPIRDRYASRRDMIAGHLRDLASIFEMCGRFLEDVPQVVQWRGRTLEELAFVVPDRDEQRECLAEATELYARCRNTMRTFDALCACLQPDPAWAQAIETVHRCFSTGHRARLFIRDAILYRRVRQFDKARQLLDAAEKERELRTAAWPRGDLMLRLTRWELESIAR